MIAYFCAEYALDSTLKTYAGGLGILAGDTLREIGDQKLPYICIGLLYRYGYESLEPTNYSHIVRIPQLISLTVFGEQVYVSAWLYKYKSAQLYLLDTNIPENSPYMRTVLSHLYDLDLRTRLIQQIILGQGGVRLLHAVGIHPDVYHMNEGHAAFLSLEAGNDAHILYTNHTSVPAGVQIYPLELVQAAFAHDKTISAAITAGGTSQDEKTFSMNTFALQYAPHMNGVSKLHSTKLRTMYPYTCIHTVTNGVHIPTWDVIQNHDITQRRAQLKEAFCKKYAIDPQALLIGWARRIVEYKRPDAILANPTLLRSITGGGTKAHIVFAGIAHHADIKGRAILAHIRTLSAQELFGSITFIDGYTMELAREMMGACDVWLNTPVVGEEACGTSGMKAALNGSLPCSTLDGWIAETPLDQIGYMLDSTNIATSIYDVLPRIIKDKTNITKWETKMRYARSTIVSQFSTKRMMREYASLYRATYQPCNITMK